MTNNLMSMIMVAGSKRLTPEVGMDASVAFYTDREAATVIKVWDVKGVEYVTVQVDHAERTDSHGMSDAQDYAYTPDPNGATYTYRFKNEKWEQVTFNAETNRWKKYDTCSLILGRKDKFYDYSF